MSSRRRFIGKAVMAGTAAVTAASLSSFTDKKEFFIHHVYFWLKNPDSPEDKTKLIEGLKKLSKVKTIRTFHMGQPAPTNRDVIDRSYSVSWLLFFDNKADQDSYQADPIHLKFVEECSSLWTKVIVYDSIDL
ncbi:MAG: Dabb family protein [Bacteroidota bacterium]